MTNGNQLSREEQAWLVEYQVCQEDNSANFQGFWTLAAIFIGLSSVFLTGLIYAVIANDSLFRALLCQNERSKTLTVGSIALIVGLANVVILKKIKGWHGRMKFNQAVNLERMREIELDLGVMHRTWRIPAIDAWYRIRSKRKGAKCRQQRWGLLEEELKCEIVPKYHGKLGKREDEILELIEYFDKKQAKNKYERPSTEKHIPWIFGTIMFLWLLVVAAAIFLIIPPSVDLLWRGLASILAIVFVCIYFKCKE